MSFFLLIKNSSELVSSIASNIVLNSNGYNLIEGTGVKSGSTWGWGCVKIKSVCVPNVCIYVILEYYPVVAWVFFPRWQKIRENASHVADLHDQTNQMVYHMSRLVHSPVRSLVAKLTKIIFY